MGTLMDKLNATNATKEQIRQAIERKKVSVPTNTPFKDYPDKIDGIYPDALFLRDTNISSKLPVALSWRTICSSDKKIVMAGCNRYSDGTNKIVCADKNGWKVVNVPVSRSWCHSAFGNGKFLLGADYTDSDQNMLYSSDAQTWKIAKLPFSAMIQGIVFDGEKFVAKTTQGVIRSNDGMAWELVAAQPPNAATTGTSGQNRIVYEFGEYFVMCTYNEFYKSADLKKWDRVNLPWSEETGCMAAGGGAIMLLGSHSRIIGYTINGVDWSFTKNNNCVNVTRLECVRGVFTYVEQFNKHGRMFIKIAKDGTRHDLVKSSRAQFLNSHILGEGLGMLISAGADAGGDSGNNSAQVMLGYDFANWTDSITKVIEDADGGNKTGQVLNVLNAIDVSVLQAAYEAGVNSI